MATYAEKLKDFSRIPAWYVKLTLDFCNNTFGIAPCVATGAGDKKCHNTFFTCKDRPNYVLTTKVYRFVSDGELPFEDGERPYIRGVKQLPTEIKDSLPILGRTKVTMLDEPDTDVGIDPYVTERTGTQGTFWRKLLERNPNYKGRPIEVYEGFIGIPESEFQLRFKGKLENIAFMNGGKVQVEGIDYIGDLKRVTVPQEYDISAGVAVSAVANTITLKGADVDVLNATTGSTYYVRINDEIIGFQSSNYDSTANQLSNVTRGAGNTPAAAIAEDDNVSIAPHYSGNIFDVMHSMLVNDSSRIDQPGAQLSTVFVDTTAFEFWRDFTVGATEVIVDGWADEQIDIDELYFDLANLFDLKTWVGEDNRITVSRNVPNLPGRVYSKITDDANIVLNTDSLNKNEKSRFTRNYLMWSYRPVTDFGLGKNFVRREVFIDLDLESSQAFGEPITKIDRTRLFRQGVMAEDAQNKFVQNRQRRWLKRRERGLPQFSIQTEYKDSDIKTGSYCKIGSDLLIDALGVSQTSAVGQVIRREITGSKVKLKLELQPLNKTGFIGPSSGGGGSTAYSTLNTDAQLDYAFISAADSASSTGAVMDNGDPAYLIF